MSVTVEQIIRQYLSEHGYDGLTNPDHECACSADDLAPCGEASLGCEPGVRVPCDCGEHDWHIDTSVTPKRGEEGQG